jgi:hypothetical protein
MSAKDRASNVCNTPLSVLQRGAQWKSAIQGLTNSPSVCRPAALPPCRPAALPPCRQILNCCLPRPPTLDL